METIENIVVDIEHECTEAIEELAVNFVFEHILSYYVLLYLSNV